MVAADCDDHAPAVPHIMADAVTCSATSVLDLQHPFARVKVSMVLPPPAAVAAFRDHCVPPTAVTVAVIADGCNDCNPTALPTMAHATISASPPELDLQSPSAQTMLSSSLSLLVVAAAFRDDFNFPRAVGVTMVAADWNDCDPTPPPTAADHGCRRQLRPSDRSVGAKTTAPIRSDDGTAAAANSHGGLRRWRRP